MCLAQGETQLKILCPEKSSLSNRKFASLRILKWITLIYRSVNLVNTIRVNVKSRLVPSSSPKAWERFWNQACKSPRFYSMHDVTSNMNRCCCRTSEGGRGALPANMGPCHNTAEVSVVPRLMVVLGHQTPGVEVRLSAGLDGV